jgi:hypoxanthine phosphoribosyltransferase
MASDGVCGPGDLSVLVSEDEIHRHVHRLARSIEQDHGHERPLLVIAVMKGAIVLLADLIRHLPMPLRIELVRARSYEGTNRSGPVEILDDLGALGIDGADVLVVDCVLDSGHTLGVLIEAVAAHNPGSLKCCVLLSKDRQRETSVTPDYVGCSIPDVFVVGYGLDCDNMWRHLPYVAVVPTESSG